MVPLFITLIGAVFLLQAFDAVSASFTAWAWPLLVTLIGLTKLMGGNCKCCANGAKK
ncbi:hypothetical protein KJZ71_03585 [Patescibacteria group bacterium]|jgi:uncharacterized integral membrane protein|uniref:DUF5668 domain-containing protein n=1 Tax=candidate division WWE3 bacterium TaxID=2053526 RepID=A0A928Y6N7_UNCKA|nr:hypothetical protein [Anaerolineales bacterium]MBE7525221.1 hypothetical protein [candidate division WWE3 bacterium]MCL4732855.1 hypothetical protein [Patescibacteria group bacterium]